MSALLGLQSPPNIFCRGQQTKLKTNTDPRTRGYQKPEERATKFHHQCKLLATIPKPELKAIWEGIPLQSPPFGEIPPKNKTAHHGIHAMKICLLASWPSTDWFRSKNQVRSNRETVKVDQLPRCRVANPREEPFTSSTRRDFQDNYGGSKKKAPHLVRGKIHRIRNDHYRSANITGKIVLNRFYCNMNWMSTTPL